MWLCTSYRHTHATIMISLLCAIGLLLCNSAFSFKSVVDKVLGSFLVYIYTVEPPIKDLRERNDLTIKDTPPGPFIDNYFCF